MSPSNAGTAKGRHRATVMPSKPPYSRSFNVLPLQQLLTNISMRLGICSKQFLARAQKPKQLVQRTLSDLSASRVSESVVRPRQIPSRSSKMAEEPGLYASDQKLSFWRGGTSKGLFVRHPRKMAVGPIASDQFADVALRCWILHSTVPSLVAARPMTRAPIGSHQVQRSYSIMCPLCSAPRTSMVVN